MELPPYFDELVNRIAFTLSREPLLIVLVPIAVILVLLVIRALWRQRRAPPSVSSDLQEATDKGQAVIATPQASPYTKGRYLIERVVTHEGHYSHSETRAPVLNFMWGEYEIQEADLYEVKPGLLDHVLWRLRGIAKKYLIIFWADNAEAIKPTPAIYQPALLSRVRTSRILSRALREIFSTSIMENKGIIFIVIAFGIIAVIWLRLQGRI